MCICPVVGYGVFATKSVTLFVYLEVLPLHVLESIGPWTPRLFVEGQLRNSTQEIRKLVQGSQSPTTGWARETTIASGAGNREIAPLDGEKSRVYLPVKKVNGKRDYICPPFSLYITSKGRYAM
jgi:hypothetical protein